MSAIRKFWPVLAVVAGAFLIYFELRRGGGVTIENGFWLFVGGLIVVLAVIDLLQRHSPPGGPPPPLDPL